MYPIANMIQKQGYEAAFLKFGLAQGIVVFLLGWILVISGVLLYVGLLDDRGRDPLRIGVG